jgi:hypothetical protein
LQKIEMLFKKEVINNSLKRTPNKKKMTSNQASKIISGMHLRDAAEVKHQLVILNRNFVELDLDRQAVLLRKSESRTMTTYGYILLPECVSDAGAKFIMQYKHGMEAKYVAKVYNLDYICFDYESRYLMFWGNDREVQQAIDYFKWIIPTHQKMRTYPKPYYTKLQDRADAREDKREKAADGSKHS